MYFEVPDLTRFRMTAMDLDSVEFVPEDPTRHKLSELLKKEPVRETQHALVPFLNVAEYPKQSIDEGQLHLPIYCPSLEHERRVLQHKQIVGTKELCRVCVPPCNVWLGEGHGKLAIESQRQRKPFVARYTRRTYGKLEEVHPTFEDVDWDHAKTTIFNTNIQIQNNFIHNNNDAEVKELREKIQLLEQRQQTSEQTKAEELKQIIETAFEKQTLELTRKRKFLEEDEEESTVEKKQKTTSEETDTKCKLRMPTDEDFRKLKILLDKMSLVRCGFIPRKYEQRGLHLQKCELKCTGCGASGHAKYLHKPNVLWKIISPTHKKECKFQELAESSVTIEFEVK